MNINLISLEVCKANGIAFCAYLQLQKTVVNLQVLKSKKNNLNLSQNSPFFWLPNMIFYFMLKAVYENKILLIKPFQASQLSVYANKILVQWCSQNEWTLEN